MVSVRNMPRRRQRRVMIEMRRKEAALKLNPQFRLTDKFVDREQKVRVQENLFVQRGQKPFFKRPEQARLRREEQLARTRGERSVTGALRATAIKNKRRNPMVARKALSDARKIDARFIDKKRVKEGEGLSRSTVFRRKK